jgi:hypothetical protein
MQTEEYSDSTVGLETPGTIIGLNWTESWLLQDEYTAVLANSSFF